jgi:hypothetical protein
MINRGLKMIALDPVEVRFLSASAADQLKGERGFASWSLAPSLPCYCGEEIKGKNKVVQIIDHETIECWVDSELLVKCTHRSTAALVTDDILVSDEKIIHVSDLLTDVRYPDDYLAPLPAKTSKVSFQHFREHYSMPAELFKICAFPVPQNDHSK